MHIGSVILSAFLCTLLTLFLLTKKWGEERTSQLRHKSCGLDHNTNNFSYVIKHISKHFWKLHLTVTEWTSRANSQFRPLWLVLNEKWELNWKFLILSQNFSQNWPILRYLESKPFATFKKPFTTCGKWQMGWTTLI